MDLSAELRRIQQQKHQNIRNNHTHTNIDNDTSNNNDSNNTSPMNMDIDNDIDIKDNNINDMNEDTKIDWDLEIAAQLQNQYEHENEQNSNNNIDNNGARINYYSNRNFNINNNDDVRSRHNNPFESFDRFNDIFEMHPMNRHQNTNINNNTNNNNIDSNGNRNANNGSYSFSFSSSNTGPNGFSMSFRTSSNNNNNNINSMPAHAQQIFERMNGGMGNSIFSNFHIDGMDHEQLLQMFPVINRGLNDNEINNNSIVDKYKQKIDVKKVDNTDTKIDKTSEECAICMDSFKDNDEIRRLPCMHIFHKHEIDKWLKTKDSCPICRQSIKQQQ